MRYPKGTLAVSSVRDIPLLTRVRNSKFITHLQLFDSLQFSGYEYSKGSFNWRIRRLLKSGYLSSCEGRFGRGLLVYRITSAGSLQLEDHGHYATTLNSESKHPPHPSQIHHALELNSIHLALSRANILISWRSDVETASLNAISRSPLQKDYDAIVAIWNGDKMARFALEYERTLKSIRAYKKIRQALESEDQIDCFLYLTSGFEVSLHLANELSGIPKRLAFATATSFRQHLLGTSVMIHPGEPEVTFRSLLGGMF